MTKRTCVIFGLILALALVMLPGAAQARMWVGAQVGANFGASEDVNFSVAGVTLTWQDVAVEPSVIAGLTIGYDFVREGFLGYNYPDWMKYFSFATDFTYNRSDRRQQFVNTSVAGVGVGKTLFPTVGPIGPNGNFIPNGTRVEGTMAVWSFLFIGKYGFFPDSEVPFGRLQPYIGVGPGIMFSSIDTAAFGSSSSVDIALITEAGLRYMALKNVSLDAAFRYRYGAPSYSLPSSFFGVTADVDQDTHQFSALFRVSYHF